MRRVVGIGLKVVAIALVVGTIALSPVVVAGLSLVLSSGSARWEGLVAIVLLFFVAPIVGAVAMWKVGNKVLCGRWASSIR